MKRRELMLIVSIAAGLTTNAMLADNSAYAKQKDGYSNNGNNGTPRGYERSGNPKASGGPENPGKGNPHNAY